MSNSSPNPIKALPHTAFKATTSLRRYFDSRGEKFRRLLSHYSATPYLAATLLTLCLAAGYALLAPSPSGSHVRLPINFQTLGPQDFPQGQDTRFPKGNWGNWQAQSAARYPAAPQSLDGGALVSGKTLAIDPEGQHYGLITFVPPAQRRGLVNFTHGLISIETVDGPIPLALLRHSPIPTMAAAPGLFQSDMFTPVDYTDSGIPPLLYGEEVDETGRPARWSKPENALPGLMACSLFSSYHSELQKLLRRTRFAPPAAQNARASQFKPIARRYAEKYRLPFSLVLAIMHTESNFNPHAVSRSQAIGLMQIMPETAGNEVHRYLTGLPGNPSLEMLFSPEHNIRYGTTYLHLLTRHHFGSVINPRSRQMCVIAAYNSGPGAVLRAFHSDRSQAIARINSLSPDEVYAILTTNLPHAENRRYVGLVLARMQSYSTH